MPKKSKQQLRRRKGRTKRRRKGEPRLRILLRKHETKHWAVKMWLEGEPRARLKGLQHRGQEWKRMGEGDLIRKEQRTREENDAMKTEIRRLVEGDDGNQKKGKNGYHWLTMRKRIEKWHSQTKMTEKKKSLTAKETTRG